jgi:hypothetical protein
MELERKVGWETSGGGKAKPFEGSNKYPKGGLNIGLDCKCEVAPVETLKTDESLYAGDPVFVVDEGV